ncbi:hypothetical protein GALL_530470 [mine drainage metagenome]|uniref:Uncharacterized protein n=1 Tax=mine drainage metagenome TaxID=410659 RepID=A0A1J5P2V5_9ZZZZ
MSVARQSRRNSHTTPTTSSTASSRVFSTSCSDARMVVVRSDMMRTSIAAGIEASSCGSAAFTPSTAVMMLAPGWRKMMSSTACSPLARPMFWLFCKPSNTLATWSRRIGAPSR